MRSGIGIYLGGGVVASVIAQALAVLRTFGTDAHMYLPGLGWVNGADAGNWLDTAFAATAVDSPVGLVMDAANTARGAELVVNGDFIDGLTGWTAVSCTASVVGGEASLTSTVSVGSAVLKRAITVVAGKTYEISGLIRNGTAQSVSIRLAQSSTGASNAGVASVSSTATSDSLVSFVYTPTAADVTAGLDVRCAISVNAVGQTGFFDNISVREVTGAIIASNNTTAQKPILRRDVSGRWYHQYTAASSQRLTTASAPFNLHDDHCVVSGVAIPVVNTGVERTTVGLSGAANVLFRLYINGTGAPSCTWRTADLVSRQITASSALPANSPRVLAMRKVGLNKTLWIDGVQQGATNTVDIPSTNLTVGALGARADNLQFFDGSKHGDILVKGVVSDTQLLVLTKAIAAFQGRTL